MQRGTQGSYRKGAVGALLRVKCHQRDEQELPKGSGGMWREEECPKEGTLGSMRAGNVSYPL